ncbi:hypothetical protein [Inquilinus sp. CA228]|uniref:hypothetical protein n=1 Tax=Inquilinus sp. CA228 TaxID=3455609 RepID=UPI003F8D7BD0
MADPIKRYWPGATFAPGSVVWHNGRRWLSLLQTGYAPGVGSGHWVLYPEPRRRARPVATARHATPAPTARTVFPTQEQSRQRAAEVLADALEKATADRAPAAKKALRFTTETLDTLAASDAAIFVAADLEARVRDEALAEELAELRLRLDAHVGKTRRD